jgi:hypothetical protein
MMRQGHLFLFFVIFVSVTLPAVVSADGISGYLELDYARTDSRTTDASGTSTDSDVTAFRQQLNLTLTRTLFPNLRLLTNGLLDNIRTTSTTSGVETVSKSRVLRPYIDLTMRTPLFTATVNYSRLEQKNEATGSSSLTNVTEAYNAIFGWRPDRLPSLDMRYTRTNIYDTKRQFVDNTDDLFTLLSQYEMTNGVGLMYRGTYSDHKAKLDQLESTTWTHDGRVTYDGKFLGGRGSIGASYEITKRSTEVVASGSGEVSFPLTPFGGLSSVNDTPTLGALDPNPALIDGNTAASAGINIGLPPLGGDTKPRNIGLDFFADTEVNEIFIYVDRDLPSDTPDIAGSFSWQIYTSQDNLNWSLRTPLIKAVFVHFQNRFEIRFPSVKARYVKVVVSPLSLAVPGSSAFPDIFVTEMQAFITQSAADITHAIDTTTHNVALDGKMRLLDIPTLYFESTYYLAKSTGAVSSKTSSWTNGLTLSHRFNPVFSGSARVAREDDSQGGENPQNSYSYIYSASINAVPLPTLSHNLAFSGRIDNNPDGELKTNSVYLQNTAELYRGISVYAGAGYTIANSTSLGIETTVKNTLVNVGASVVPNPKLLLYANYYSSSSKQKGTGRPESTLPNSTANIGLSYRPFPLLYFVTSWSWVEQQDRTMTLQNYNISWTPFPSGQLQCGFTYTENIASSTTNGQSLLSAINGKVRILLGTVRWNITQRSYLQVSYQVTDNNSENAGSSKIKIFETVFRVFL